ncbi:MAG: hypothetical protein WA778_04375, partial [Pseudolabrys sp.]
LVGRVSIYQSLTSCLTKSKSGTVKTRGTSLQSPAGRRNGGAFMQKHFSMLLAAATIGLVVSQASAADLPRKAPA